MPEQMTSDRAETVRENMLSFNERVIWAEIKELRASLSNVEDVSQENKDSIYDLEKINDAR